MDGMSSLSRWETGRVMHMANPRSKLGRRVECRAVLDAFVEEHDVRRHSLMLCV